jgi:hypothetical protein
VVVIKRPFGDEKTSPVRSASGGGEKKAEKEEAKTAFVSQPPPLPQDPAKTQFAHLQERDPFVTPQPTPATRLPWPARDQKDEEFLRPSVAKRPPQKAPPQQRESGSAPEEAKTKLFGSHSRQVHPDNGAAEDAERDPSDPVVGWVVIVEGPGKGISLELGAGSNSIGRDPSQKVCVDFGDQEIHREKHAAIIYDPRSRRFFLQNGDTRNLTYLGDSVVLASTELKGGEIVALGQTQLKFVPFCGKDFSWS